MKFSESFIKTSKTAPKDETARSAGYLIRAGYIYKEMAGVYTYLPLGLAVIDKIEQIVREEMNALGAAELLMTGLQNPRSWEATGRFSDEVMDIWFKTELNAGGELGLAPTHEEPITNMLSGMINSYKDLPVYLYQFQTKFRNELRAKSGILRTREFIMKDLYSFSVSREEHEKFYARVEEAYKKVFQRVGLGNDTIETFASGGAFSKYSHEFQTLLPVGEDTIYYNEDRSICLNSEVMTEEVMNDLGVSRDELKSAQAAEVGNIFTLGYKFSEPLGLYYNDADGSRKPVFMGSYGIGVSRLMGVIAEKFADGKGLCWPEEVAPAQYYLIAIGEKGASKAREIYEQAPEKFLFDDRENARPGEKFADSELIGLPYRVVISDKTLEEGKFEVVTRRDGEKKLLTEAEFLGNI